MFIKQEKIINLLNILFYIIKEIENTKDQNKIEILKKTFIKKINKSKIINKKRKKKFLYLIHGYSHECKNKVVTLEKV